MARLLIFAMGFCSLLIVSVVAEEEKGILDCFYEVDQLACAKNTTDAELDKIELEITGKKSQIKMSRVIEESGSFVAEGARALFGDEEFEDATENEEETGIQESRKKKFGKKKKKLLLKLIPVAMLIKAKISLILQLISTHFQAKFFAIALISLVINVARFWIDLKKSHEPSKVVYYEHAQHQHHYDHDDDHGGYWGRSADNVSEELPYNAWAPTN